MCLQCLSSSIRDRRASIEQIYKDLQHHTVIPAPVVLDLNLDALPEGNERGAVEAGFRGGHGLSPLELPNSRHGGSGSVGPNLKKPGKNR